MNSKNHWDNVFSNKMPNEVSWTQGYPELAMNYIAEINLPKTAKIIEIGSGNSNFVDALLENGYENIWVLDVSETAIDIAKKRLGKDANKVHWLVSDITAFTTEVKFDFWYDRAVFHFLTTKNEIDKYISNVGNFILSEGHFLLGTFSENGPKKCSGLDITQYSEVKMTQTFEKEFKVVNCFTEMHNTPFDTEQHFQFCGFRKK